MLNIMAVVLATLVIPSAASHEVPTGQEVLQTLQRLDAELQKPWFAKGMTHAPENSMGVPRRVLSWEYSSEAGRTALAERLEEVKSLPQAPRLRRGSPAYALLLFTAYREQGATGWWQHQAKPGFITTDLSELWDAPRSDSVMVDSSMTKSLDRPLARHLWCMGRGYAEYIDAVTHVEAAPEGLLKLTAEGTGIASNNRGTWQLLVDPEKDWLVRSAQFQNVASGTFTYTIETAGEIEGGPLVLAASGTWMAPSESGGKQKVEVFAVRSEIPPSMLEESRSRVFGPFANTTAVLNLHAEHLTRSYMENETLSLEVFE